MYTSVRNAPEVPGAGAAAVGTAAAPVTAEPGRSHRRRIAGQVGGTVVAMGAVSFLTDASAEMVTAVLPLFLILQVGLTPLQYGVVDGVYQGATVLVRLVGGYLADRWRRPKIVCTVGYGLSAVTKLGLLGVGSAASTSLVLAVDRAGKGLRTAPRDAVIAAATRPALLGRAFGVHRTMDTAGAGWSRSRSSPWSWSPAPGRTCCARPGAAPRRWPRRRHPSPRRRGSTPPPG